MRPRIIQLTNELADAELRRRWDGSEIDQINDGNGPDYGCVTYTEQAQDEFNELTDEIEFVLLENLPTQLGGHAKMPTDRLVYDLINAMVYDLQETADPRNERDLGGEADFYRFADGMSFSDLINDITQKLAEYKHAIGGV
jgi:hypothetical protein